MSTTESPLKGKTAAAIAADVLDTRAEMIADLVEDLLGALAYDGADAPPWRRSSKPDVQQAITEARRIRDAVAVKYLTGEEAFRDADKGVCLLGEDHEEALLLGHIEQRQAAVRAAAACMELCGLPFDEHHVDDLAVEHEWGVFEDCSWNDYSDWSWWFHRTCEPKSAHAVAVTRVRLV